MQFVLIFLLFLQFIVVAYSFRDHSANYPSSASSGKQRYIRTVYEKSLKNVLSRKKRGFVFSKGTVVVLTDNAAKGLLPTSPRGLLQSNEVDIFYDVPLLVEGWRQPFNDYVKNMKLAAKKYEKEQEIDEKLKNFGVVNATAIPLDQYYNGPHARPIWSRYPLIYENDRNNVWNANRRNYNQDYRRPYNNRSSNYQYPNAQRRNYVQSGPKHRYYATNRSTKNASTDYHRNRQFSSHNTAKQSTQSNDTPLWHHHREYRERRSIYEHLDTFGKALGLKLRKCILRAICEMGQSLLPEGQSFINDVARILFTVPTDHDNTDDEFTQMALEKNVDCARRFLISCPHSPLDYFLTHFAAKDVRPVKEPTTEDIIKNINYY